MPIVVRDAVNDQTRSRYAKLETISEKMDPVIQAHGFSLSFGTADCPLPNHYRVTCKVRHNAGYSELHHADVPADMLGMKGNQNKTATHAYGSTLSYGRRYLKTLIFDVVIKDQDDDGRRAGSGTFITADQVKTVRQGLVETKADEAAFLQYLGADSIETIPGAKWQGVVQALNAKRRALANTKKADQQ
jgi:hypothetical protein